MCSRGRHERVTLRLTKNPTPASSCDAKAIFGDTAERLPRKEPTKRWGFVQRRECTNHGQNHGPGGTGAQNRGCPHRGTPTTLHSTLSNISNTLFFVLFPVSRLWRRGRRSAAAPEAKASCPGCFPSVAAFSSDAKLQSQHLTGRFGFIKASKIRHERHHRNQKKGKNVSCFIL